MRKLLREPLVHFLVLGAVVFAVFHVAGRNEAAEGKIVVTPGRVEHLVTGFSRTWRRPPTAKELDGLVEDHIREEVLYREALALGLDKDDTIVRRRMRQKLEFLAGDLGVIAAPSDQELQAWLEKHPAKFGVEPAVAFAQVYFKPGRDARDVSTALAQLGEARVDSTELGDATSLPGEMDSSVGEVGRVFGDDFAHRVARLEPGRWSGPVSSTYGSHIVRVSQRREASTRPLAEVRDAVRRDWLAAKSREVVDSTYAGLRGKYTIVVEGTASP